MSYIIIDLDKPRRFRLDLNAICDIEDMFDAPLQDIFNAKKMGTRHLRGILWAGLRPFDNRITIETAGNLLQEYLKPDLKGRSTELGKKYREALVASGFIDTTEPSGDETKNVE